MNRAMRAFTNKTEVTTEMPNESAFEELEMNANLYLSPAVSITVAVITAIPILINLVFLIVCLRTLKKKLHNLLVLSLCICDSFLSASLTCFGFSSLNPSVQRSITSCIVQTICVCYGLVSTYSIVFLICYERYLVIKSKNVGIKQLLNRFKYTMIGGTLSFGLLYTLETVLFVPREADIECCGPLFLYGKNYHLFVTFIGGYVTLLLCLIVLTSLQTCYYIWVIFFKKKIGNAGCKVTPKNLNTKQVCTNDASNQSDINRNRTDQKYKFDKFTSDYIKEEYNTCTGLSKGDYRRNTESQISTKPSASENKRNTCTSLQNANQVVEVISKSYKLPDIAIVNNTVKEKMNESESSNNLSANKAIRNISSLIQILRSTKSNQDTQPRVETLVRTPRRRIVDPWEIKAFSTSLIISITTVFLTFPFVCAFWMDVGPTHFVTRTTRYIMFCPLVINSIVNPFIYAWRIPEIKQEFSKIFKS